MSKQSIALVGLAVAGAAATLIWFAAFDWASWVCRMPSGDSGKALTTGPLGCFEFWFNRYQTLMGAIFALIAAWIATIPARGQLKEMSKQSAAAARQSMVDISRALESELNLVQDISIFDARALAVVETYIEEDFDVIYENWPTECNKARREIRDLIQKLDMIFNRYGEDDIIFTSRTRLLDQMRTVSCKLQRLHLAFRQQTSGVDPEFEEEMDDGEIRFIGRETAASLEAMRLICSFAKDELAAGIRSSWTEVRALEARQIHSKSPS